jgi:acetyltransferase-like isoleucine patch superfamily enzyme
VRHRPLAIKATLGVLLTRAGRADANLVEALLGDWAAERCRRASRADEDHTYSGGRDQTAVIGHAPEDRNWKPGDRAHKPFICSGARIEAYVTVDAGTKRATHIGRRTWLMKHVHVGHDAHIGQDCEIAPGARHLRLG